MKVNYRLRCICCGKTASAYRISKRSAFTPFGAAREQGSFALWLLYGRVAVCDCCTLTLTRKITNGKPVHELPPAEKASVIRACAARLRRKHKAKPGRYVRSGV